MGGRTVRVTEVMVHTYIMANTVEVVFFIDRRRAINGLAEISRYILEESDICRNCAFAN